MRYAYPVEVVPDEGDFTVTSPDVPELVTGGWVSRQDNLDKARDALVAALSFYIDDDRPLPHPSPQHPGQELVVVPPLAAAKFALHEAKLAKGITNTGLGKLLGLHEREVRRLLDPMHNSRIGMVDGALRALGRRLVVEVEAA